MTGQEYPLRAPDREAVMEALATLVGSHDGSPVALQMALVFAKGALRDLLESCGVPEQDLRDAELKGRTLTIKRMREREGS